jgi:hypothetical protein
MRFPCIHAISLVPCALLIACGIAAAQQPCRSTALVTVLDRKTNQPVDGLLARNFLVKFRDREISVRAVAPPPAERRIVFVLDRSGSMTYVSNDPSAGRYDPNLRLRSALGNALSAIPGGDTVAFLAFAGKFANQTEFMPAAIALRRMPEILKWKPEGAGQKGRTALWDNLDSALRILTPHKAGDVIVVISDGEDNFSSMSDGKLREELVAVSVSLLAMLVTDPFAPTPVDPRLPNLLDLVNATGGTATKLGVPPLLIADPDVVLPVRPSQLILQLTHQYDLELDYSPIQSPQKWQLSVTLFGVRQEGASVLSAFPLALRINPIAVISG